MACVIVPRTTDHEVSLKYPPKSTKKWRFPLQGDRPGARKKAATLVAAFSGLVYNRKRRCWLFCSDGLLACGLGRLYRILFGELVFNDPGYLDTGRTAHKDTFVHAVAERPGSLVALKGAVQQTAAALGLACLVSYLLLTWHGKVNTSRHAGKEYDKHQNDLATKSRHSHPQKAGWPALRPTR